MAHNREHDQTEASVISPATPFCPHSDDTDVPTPALVAVYPSAESSNVPQKGRAKEHTITNEAHDFYQETPTSRSMRPFLGSLTELLASPTPTPEVQAPQPRLLKYSDSSSSDAKVVASNPSSSSRSSHTPDSFQTQQSRLTVQLTPVNDALSELPNEEQTLVTVRLLTEDAVTDVPADAEENHGTCENICTAVKPSQQPAEIEEAKDQTQRESCSSNSTAPWGAYPPGSVDVRDPMRQATSSLLEGRAGSFLSPGSSPVRRFSYSMQDSAPYSEDRFQVSPLQTGTHSPPHYTVFGQDKYEPWPDELQDTGLQNDATNKYGHTQPPFSFQHAGSQYMHQAHVPETPPGFPSRSQSRSLYGDSSMPPQLNGQPTFATGQSGHLEQGSSYAPNHMQAPDESPIHQGPYVQGAFADDQPYVLGQRFTAPYALQPAARSDLAMQGPYEGPDQWMPCNMPHRQYPPGRRRPMRYYRGSPPYYKDLGSPPRLTASLMQRTREARPTAGGGNAASQKPLGTGAFIPQPFAASKPIGRYVAPALRANNEDTWRSCNPLAGKDLNNAVTMCHVLASKGRGLEHVDKATVKELVRQQIACEKPMFAPWYRDTENISPRMRPRRPEWRPQSGPYCSHFEIAMRCLC